MIDHEAAKLCAEGMLRISNGDSDIAEAYLDLHDQLSAERARLDALAELVYVTAEQASKLSYHDLKTRIDRIMEGCLDALKQVDDTNLFIGPERRGGTLTKDQAELKHTIETHLAVGLVTERRKS